MSKKTTRGETIRKYIINNVENEPRNIAKKTSEKFSISRQAVNKHLRKLVKEDVLYTRGNNRNLKYYLKLLFEWKKSYSLDSNLEEDIVWRNDILPLLDKMPENIVEIWNYGFTEMFNNAIDHSEGKNIFIRLKKTAKYTEIAIFDDGIGIFKKIQTEFELLDERHAILELSKGKVTTDPNNHSGEGIFFTSRMLDDFNILSGGIYFSHKFEENEDWILERDKFASGTGVWMKLDNNTNRNLNNIFNKFSADDEYGFTKTVVPVSLAKYGDDQLVSRSQAKRLLTRVDKFKTVILDFKNVDIIGQAFADEVFRVFKNKHKEIELHFIHANSKVKRMIIRAQSNKV